MCVCALIWQCLGSVLSRLQCNAAATVTQHAYALVRVVQLHTLEG